MRIITIAISWLCIGSIAFAQQVGDTVFVIESDAEIKKESKVVTKLIFGEQLTVLQNDGDRIWINHEGTKCWIKRSDVASVEEAIKVCTEGIRNDPNDFFKYQLRSFAWKQSGKLKDAISDLTECIRIKPHAIFYNQRGLMLRDTRQPNKAISDFNEAIRLGDGEFKFASYGNRGVTWLMMGDTDKAIADLNEAIQLHPHDPMMFSNRALAWADHGKPAKAISDYSEALRLNPKYVPAYSNRGNFWRKQGEYAKAIADCSEAIRLNPQYVKAYYSRAMTFRDSGKYTKAIADFSKVIKLAPTFHGAYWGRAMIYATCPDARYRNGKLAIKNATKACEMRDWKNPYYLDSLAAAYAESGDFDNAVKWQQKAIDLAYTSQKEDCKKRLKLYKAGKPFRTKAKE